jgi:hypothetical protein
MGFEVFFRLGVDGAALVPFVVVSVASGGTTFLFLPILVGSGGADPFLTSSLMEAALSRLDLLEDIP